MRPPPYLGHGGLAATAAAAASSGRTQDMCQEHSSSGGQASGASSSARKFASFWAWLHAVVVFFVDWWEYRVLTPWEEFVTSTVRHGFHEAARIFNGFSAWFLSFFNARHRQSLKESWQHNPWQKWWGEVESRPSTLNAILANLSEQDQGTNSAAKPQGTRIAGLLPFTSHSRSRK